MCTPEHLDIPLQHKQIHPDSIQLTFINSKGFGGNNATGWVLSGQACREKIRASVNEQTWHEYLAKNEKIRAKQKDYLNAMEQKNQPLPVRDKEELPEPDDIELSKDGMKLPGWKERITF